MYIVKYIDFKEKDTLGNVRKLKGFFVGGYGRIFNFKYSYDSMTRAGKYTSVTSDNRELYSLGIESGYQAVYHRFSFEIFLGYCIFWQYDYINRFKKDPPFVQPADNISRWAKHHIGVGIGYAFK